MAVRRFHAQVGRRDALILAALLLVALILRAARLDFQPLWWDEGYSVWFARHSLAEMLQLTAQDIHPPLYYALLGGWSRLLGPAPVALRLLSVLTGLLAVALAYVVGGRLGGRRAGLLAALLLAINPLAIFYAQEIRMYALMTVWALLAVGAAASWVGIGEAASARGEGAAEQPQRRRWQALAAYMAAITLALYTQYYAAFLLAGLTTAGAWVLWRQRAPRSRIGWWLAAQGGIVLLYLPWLRFATPRLVAYVSQKVVADSDKPLGLLTYLLRHLSAFNAGHLEGPLAPWWLVGLLGLLPLAWALWRLRTAGDGSRPAVNGQRSTVGGQSSLIEDQRADLGSVDSDQEASGRGVRSGRRPQAPVYRTLGFLAITLAVVLALAWLVNLTFPFFPDRGERLLLLALPVYLLLVAVAVDAAWRSEHTQSPAAADNQASPELTPPSRSAHRPSSSLRFLSFPSLRPLPLLLPFLLLSALSLAAFYTVPRYAEEDYRPLIGQVTQWGRPQDTVFAVFPWQVGYFWSYGQPDGPQPALSPDDAWSPAVAHALDTALAAGHLWFPAHLSLGGILESAAEQYLAGRAYRLANRWYSPSTRLTGWAAANAEQSWQIAATPVTFSNGAALRAARFGPIAVEAANAALLLDLAWEGDPATARHLSLRLADADGRTWAQQDIALAGEGNVDRVGLLIPAGAPPGLYDLRLSVRSSADAAPWDVIGPDGRTQGVETTLGQVQVLAPDTPPSTTALPIDRPLAVDLGDAVRLLGFSATDAPLAPGDDLILNLFWQALPSLARTEDDLAAFVQLLDSEGQVRAAWEGPVVPWHPTSAWQPGELVRSQHTLRLPATLADGRYRLIAGLFAAGSKERLPSAGGLLRPERDYVLLEQVTVAGREHVMAAPQPQVAVDAALARLGRLVGYDLSTTTVAPGQPFDLTLYWQAQEVTGDRLSVFVHLLDAQGNFLAQADSEPGGGALPTSGWLPGEYLADRHTLTVRPGAAAGPATLVVGLYDPRTGERVPWRGVAGQPSADQFVLPTVVEVGQ